MRRIVRNNLMFNEDVVPDFGSIEKRVHRKNLYYLFAEDIPKLNNTFTRAVINPILCKHEYFNVGTGALAFVVDHKGTPTGEIYVYHFGLDHWFEFNINSKLKKLDFMWNRHARILRETKTISGTPPLTFKSKGRPLKNYRIYGNTVNGESVGDLVTEGDHAGEYCITVRTEGKNLLENTAITQNINGMSVTVNNNGSIILNGTLSDGVAYIVLNTDTGLTIGESYILSSGIPLLNNGYLSLRSTTEDPLSIDLSLTESRKFTATSARCRIYIWLGNGYSCSNMVISPMLRKSSVLDDSYEPYAVPSITKIYISQQLSASAGQAEYIDYKCSEFVHSDTSSDSIIVPELPTIHGTNVLSVISNVQPTSIYIQGSINEI